MSIRTQSPRGHPIHRCSNQDCGALYECNRPWGNERVDGNVHQLCPKLCEKCRK